MSHEEMPSNKGVSEEASHFERGPSAAAVGFSGERENIRESKGQEYKDLQMKILKLEEDLSNGNERALNEKNPGARELAVMIGRELTQQIETLQAQKLGLEDAIRSAGGNPSDYTVQ